MFRLIENGKLDLYEPIKNLLPARTRVLMRDKGYNLDSITVGHLLSQRGGIPSMVTKKWLKKEGDNLKYRWSRDEQIRDAILTMDKPNLGKYLYSDLNFSLLSEIMEGIEDRSFYLTIRDLLKFEELGLDHTWFYSLEAEPKETKVRFHQYKESRNWVSTYDESPTWGLFGAAGLVSTAEDLAKFSQALSTGMIFDNPETLSLMLSDLPALESTKSDLGDGYEGNYKMGIEIITGPNLNMYGHDGYWGSLMYHFPDQNVSFAFYHLNPDEPIDFSKMSLEILKAIK